MKVNLFIAAILFVISLVSCERIRKQNIETSDTQLSELKSPSPSQNETKKIPAKERQKIPLGMLQTLQSDTTGIPANVQSVSSPDWDKKIIKTAQLQIEVKDFKNYNGNIHTIVKNFGGYIAKEEQHSGEEKIETAIVIKVPVEQFDGLMNELPGNDNKVLEKNIATEDVTGDMVDTRLRLESKKGMRLKYLEFLKQSKNMEEVLQVQNEINGIQEEMESAAGRMEFLAHQSSYSTINLSFYQPVNGFTPVDGPPGFLSRMGKAFQSGTTWMADLFIGLLSIWPLLILVAAGYLGWRKIKPSKIMVQKV